jgi:hypothetical protein
MAAHWGREWRTMSMPVARKKRRHYADNNHGGGTAEFEQMTSDNYMTVYISHWEGMAT